MGRGLSRLLAPFCSCFALFPVMGDSWRRWRSFLGFVIGLPFTGLSALAIAGEKGTV
jgi:hypothetical protein